MRVILNGIRLPINNPRQLFDQMDLERHHIDAK